MDCPSYSGLIAFVDGAGTGTERATLQLHVEGCATCQALIAQYQEVSSDISGAFGEIVSAQSRHCPVLEKLDSLVERPTGLSSLERAVIEKHVEQCSSCSEYIVGLRRWLTVPVEAPVPQHVLRDVIKKATAPKAQSRRLRLGMPAAISVLTGIMLLVVSRGVIDLQRKGGESGQPAGTTSQPESHPAESQRPAPPPVVANQSPPSPIATPMESFPKTAPSPIEHERTRSLSGAPADSILTFRMKSRTGVQEIPLPPARELSMDSGAEYGFRLEPGSSVRWLYVFQVDSTGSVSVLFPNARFGTASNPIAAGLGLSLPSLSSWYQLDEVAGKEEAYAFIAASACQECERVVALAIDQTGRAHAEAALRKLLLHSTSTAATSQRCKVVAFQFWHRGIEKRKQ